MDIICPVCGEPWEHDCLHEAAESSGASYQTVAAQFRSVGCKALESAYGSQSHCKRAIPTEKESRERSLTRAEVASAMYDLLGDDMDGAAAMLEDYEAGY